MLTLELKENYVEVLAKNNNISFKKSEKLDNKIKMLLNQRFLKLTCVILSLPQKLLEQQLVSITVNNLSQLNVNITC